MPRRTNVKGLDEMLATLRRLPDEFKGRPVQRSLRQGMQVIANDAKARAPVDEGRIRDNILVRQIPAKDLGGNSSEGVMLTVRRSRNMDRDDPKNAWYWHILEFGSKFQSAQPFIRPAFEANKQNAVNQYVATFQSLLDKSVERARKGGYGSRRTSV